MPNGLAMTHTVRVAHLASITGWTREAIRNMSRDGAAPWCENDFPDGQHRQFSGEHALALVIQSVLIEQGLTAFVAGEAVRTQIAAIRAALDAADGGADLPKTLVALVQVCEEHEVSGICWMPILRTGGYEPDELVEEVRRRLAGNGRVSRQGKHLVRQVAGPRVASVPISEAYLILCARARRAGYAIQGRNIVRSDSLPEADAWA